MLKAKELFLDIETTGLTDDPSTTISTIGTLSERGYRSFRSAGEFRNFLENEEPAIQKFITYNGTRFDLPLLAKFGCPIAESKHVDLFPLASEHLGNGAFLKLESALERVGARPLPHWISGRECAEFAKGGFRIPNSFGSVCLHNACDLFATSVLYSHFVARGWI